MNNEFESFNDMLAQVLQILPGAEVGEDNDGQLVIYTNMTLENGKIVSMNEEDV